MFYIFHGEDGYTKLETLRQLLGRLGDPAVLELNTTRLSRTTSIAAMRQAAETVPFLSPARVVIVEDYFSAKPVNQEMKAVLDFLPLVPDSTRLVFLESETLRDSHVAIRLAESEPNGHQRDFPLPKGGQLTKWIQDRARDKGGEISIQAATLLAALVGSDLGVLDNELEKLVIYRQTDDAQLIEAADVEQLSPYVAEASIFDLVDALGGRNERAAARLYQQKVDEGADPFYLFSMFVRQFRLLIQVKELAEDGLSPPAVARELRLHEYVAGKLSQQARGFQMQELERVYSHLLKIDVGAKTGRTDMQTELELMVANLTLGD